MATKKRTSKAETDTDPSDTAKVEGRSTDGPEAPPVEEQSETGEFAKVYLVGGKHEAGDEADLYLEDAKREAIRQGLRPTGDAYLEGWTVEKVGRYTSSRLVVKVPVRTAASA